MSNLVKIAPATAVPEGKAAAFDVGEKRIAIFNDGGTYLAIDDTCPHAGASLAEGEVSGGKVNCPFHAADFDLRTGAALCPPARHGVKAYKVVAQEGDLYVEVEP